MTGVILAGALLLATLSASPSPPASCARNDLLAIQGRWMPLRNASSRTGLPRNDVNQVAERVDRIGRLLRAAYPEPKGMQAEASWDFRGSGRPYPYALNSLYKAWYCNTNVDKLMLGDETGTWAYAFVNHLNWFASAQKDFQVDGRPVYLLTPRSGELKGRPVYAGIHNSSSNTGQRFSRTVLVGRPGRSPLRPVTRRAFLEAFLARTEAREQSDLASLERSALDPVRKAEAQRRLQASYERDLQPARTRLKTLSVQEGGEPAILGPGGVVLFKDFASEQKGGQALVFLDPHYFDPRQPPYVPQFVVLYWSWDNNVPAQNFRAELERNIDLDAIAALLDR
jgi:hypothetical protein